MAHIVKGLLYNRGTTVWPWSKILLHSGKWQPTLYCSGNLNGWRSWVGYCPLGSVARDGLLIIFQFHFTSAALRRSKFLRIIVLDTTVSRERTQTGWKLIAQIKNTCFTKRGTKSTEALASASSKSEEYYFHCDP